MHSHCFEGTYMSKAAHYCASVAKFATA